MKGILTQSQAFRRINGMKVALWHSSGSNPRVSCVYVKKHLTKRSILWYNYYYQLASIISVTAW